MKRGNDARRTKEHKMHLLFLSWRNWMKNFLICIDYVLNPTLLVWPSRIVHFILYAQHIREPDLYFSILLCAAFFCWSQTHIERIRESWKGENKLGIVGKFSVGLSGGINSNTIIKAVGLLLVHKGRTLSLASLSKNLSTFF